MSGDQEQEQASGLPHPHRPPPFGRQSTAPAYGQSESDARSSSSSFEVSPITPFPSSTLSNTHPSRRRSGLESVISAISPPPSGGQPYGLTRMGRESPDPDDYYRQTGLAPAPLKAGRGKLTGGRTSMAFSSNLSEEVSVPTNPANTLDPARTRQPIPRSVSDSPTVGSGGLAVGAPAVRFSARPRQPSFKDLVDKFNNGSDSILPIPSASPASSATPVTPASPASRTASPSGCEFDKNHSDTLSRRRQYRESLAPSFHTDQFRSPIDESYPASPSSLYSPQADAELSTAVLLPIQRQVPKVHARKPVPGEVLTLDTQVNNNPTPALGLGLPAHLKRRGSDGSITSANTAFLDPGNQASIGTPLTPTAWYLGRANTLEAVQPNVNRGIGHRRSRTELDNTFNESLTDPWNPDMAVSVPLQGKPGDGSPNSRSRIPVSSHRRNSGSGSEPLSPSTHPTFSNRASTIPLPPKGASRLPKPLPGTSSPTRMTEDGPASFALTARGRRDIAAGRARYSVPDRSKLLQAYVSAPPPKKSPPLRSSRPRYAISIAGVPTPEINKRLSNLQKAPDRANPRRVRQLPELSNVDLEARRQQIQQAFARTVEENEKKEEQAAELRRRTRVDMIPDSLDDNQSTLSGSTNRTVLPADMTTTVTESIESGVENGKEPRNQPLLRLNTSFSLSDSNGTSDSESLTMGLPGARSPRDMSTRPDMLSAVPESAVPQSASSDHTHFDLEPQTRLIERKPSTAEAHRTLLNHIMQIRESSSSSECDDNDCSSDHDDQESSEMMRHGPTYFRTSSSVNAEEASQATHLAQVDRPRDDRWSMSSWSSSVHHHDSSFDDDCDEEDSGDDLIVQRPTPVKEASPPPPAVERTPEAAHRRASFADDEHEDSPVQADLGVTGPDTLKMTPLPQPNLFASGASLVKKGKWDSRRATQLYLEQLTQGKTSDFGLGTTRPSPRDPPVGISSPGLPPIRPASTEQTPFRHPVRQPEYVRPRQDMRVPPVLPEDPKETTLNDELMVIPRYQDPRIKAARQAHTASLVGPADWEDASPSVMDWMQVAAEDEGVTPAHERPDFVNDGLRNARVLPKSQLSVTSNNLQIEPQAGQKDQALPVSRGTESSEDSLRRADYGQSERAADSSVTSLAPSAEHLMRTETKKASPSPEARRLRKRRNVIKELVDTEHTFGRDMKVVEDIYKGTSGSCLDLSPEDVRTLFANSAEVVQFSQNFQDALKLAARSIYVMPKSQRYQSKRNSTRPTPQASDETPSTDAAATDLEKDCATSIGEVFIAHIVQMEKVYAEYMKNYEFANKKLQMLRRNPKVDIWLAECRQWASDLTTAWDLESLLVKPVQRILKYPLLLGELLDATPEDHPDHENIMKARTEVTNTSHRINDQKRRADVVTQVIGRKSDVRSNISKAFGRRTEKFRQQVGVSDMFEDKEYDALAQSFGDGFFQLQVVMRDVESYVRETTAYIDKLNDVVLAIEAVMNVSQSNYPELEIRWRRFKAAVRDCVVVALPEHITVVRETVIQPMVTLLKLHEGPQRVMKKRDKRLFDYARHTALVKRGDKPDRKTVEQGEQFLALNDTLKEELPKLYALTAKLMEACLKNFVQLQVAWWGVKQNKLKPHVDVFPEGFEEVIDEWASDYTFAEAQLLSLGIANGSVLADTLNQMNVNAPPEHNGAESRRPSVGSRRRASTVNSSTQRTGSLAEDSPKHSYSQDLTGVSALFQSPRVDSHVSSISSARHNSGSSFARRFSSDSANASRNLQQVTQQTQPAAVESNRTNSGDSFSNLLPALTIDGPTLSDMFNPGGEPQTPAGARYSGFFSSAMPMSDNPNETESSQAADTASKEPRVIFTVASLYEFNIDRSRREAGYPYLTYVAGEVFDVIGEKGELWLARNQDDSTHQVGWIWEKHFAKLSA